MGQILMGGSILLKDALLALVFGVFVSITPYCHPLVGESNG